MSFGQSYATALERVPASAQLSVYQSVNADGRERLLSKARELDPSVTREIVARKIEREIDILITRKDTDEATLERIARINRKRVRAQLLRRESLSERVQRALLAADDPQTNLMLFRREETLPEIRAHILTQRSGKRRGTKTVALHPTFTGGVYQWGGAQGFCAEALASSPNLSVARCAGGMLSALGDEQALAWLVRMRENNSAAARVLLEAIGRGVPAGLSLLKELPHARAGRSYLRETEYQEFLVALDAALARLRDEPELIAQSRQASESEQDEKSAAATSAPMAEPVPEPEPRRVSEWPLDDIANWPIPVMRARILEPGVFTTWILAARPTRNLIENMRLDLPWEELALLEESGQLPAEAAAALLGRPDVSERFIEAMAAGHPTILVRSEHITRELVLPLLSNPKVLDALSGKQLRMLRLEASDLMSQVMPASAVFTLLDRADPDSSYVRHTSYRIGAALTDAFGSSQAHWRSFTGLLPSFGGSVEVLLSVVAGTEGGWGADSARAQGEAQ